MHEFRLKLPNGLDLAIAGDRDFVLGAYQDVKVGAAELFRREAAVATLPPVDPPALPAPAPPPAAPSVDQPVPGAELARATEEEREAYYDVLLRFREQCEARGQTFMRGMRLALAAAMGEAPTFPPLAKTRDKRRKRKAASTAAPAADDDRPDPDPPEPGRTPRRKLSEETRRRMSEGRKRYFAAKRARESGAEAASPEPFLRIQPETRPRGSGEAMPINGNRVGARDETPSVLSDREWFRPVKWRDGAGQIDRDEAYSESA